MASVTSELNGKKTIQFVGADGKRRSIRLGKATMQQAVSVKGHVENLASAAITRHSVNSATATWLTSLDRTLLKKLAAVRLINDQPRSEQSFPCFVDAYVKSRPDAKPGTVIVWKRARSKIVQFFGNRPMASIGAGDAKDFRAFMLNAGLAENTVRKMCAVASQFFTDAIDRDLISGKNPFTSKSIPRTTRENRDRDHFIDRDSARKVIDACPDAEWRLLFALSRFGGLRCPSEHLSLRWADVNFVAETVLVHSPKTEHHAGKESRLIPLFPELRPFLEDAFDQAAPGSEFAISRYRSQESNLRSQLHRIIKLAGLKPWPKLFHNLRASRETELVQDHPLHVVCAWIGNNPTIAAKHYLQVRPSDFEKAVQNVVQSSVVIGGNAPNQHIAVQVESRRKQPVSPLCSTSQQKQMVATGLEPVTFCV